MLLMLPLAGSFQDIPLWLYRLPGLLPLHIHYPTYSLHVRVMEFPHEHTISQFPSPPAFSESGYPPGYAPHYFHRHLGPVDRCQ